MNKIFAVSDYEDLDYSTTTYHVCKSAEEAVRIAYEDDNTSNSMDLYVFEVKPMGKFKIKKTTEISVTKVR